MTTAGITFADADLLGCPVRLTVGRRSLESGTAEALRRRGREQLEAIPLGSAAEAVRDQWRDVP